MAAVPASVYVDRIVNNLDAEGARAIGIAGKVVV